MYPNGAEVCVRKALEAEGYVKDARQVTEEKPILPRFADGKFFHDVPLFDLDYLKSRHTPKATKSK